MDRQAGCHLLGQGQGQPPRTAPQDPFAGELTDDFRQFLVRRSVEDLAAFGVEALGLKSGRDIDRLGQLNHAIFHHSPHLRVSGRNDRTVVPEGCEREGDFPPRMPPQHRVDLQKHKLWGEICGQCEDSAAGGPGIYVSAVGWERGDGGCRDVAVEAYLGFQTPCCEMNGGVTGSCQVVRNDGYSHMGLVRQWNRCPEYLTRGTDWCENLRMPNMIGAYGDWASGLAQDPPRLSFRRAGWANVGDWQRQARAKYLAALLQPDTGGVPKAIVQHAVEFDGLAFEHMTWQLPYGPPTEAVFVKPVGATGKLPGVLALHDHGGNKYFGTRKLIRMSADPHPMMIEHQNRYYGGAAWVNELARRGYGVLVSDAFTFGSRRVRVGDVPAAIRQGLTEQNPEATDEIQKYNTWAAGHEHIMAKSLFSAGTTWPGTFVGEDQRALDYLCSRPDVDAARVGCCGLSGGGLRTVFLTGADARLKCSCAVGMMTTWRDYLMSKSYTHTWMSYVPGMPLELDYPEIYGLNLPNAVMVLNNREDQLFTLSEMERADRILGEVYRKAGLSERYKTNFYPGPHKFDRDMQRDAFAWFDKWLKA